MSISFLQSRSPSQVRELMLAFDNRYKRDWELWMSTAWGASLGSPEAARHFAGVLRKWQAVRSGVRGRTVRPCRSSTNHSAGLFVDDLLMEAQPFVAELGRATLRDATRFSATQSRALKHLWDIFRSIPTKGEARAAGITKAVKLVTGGRIGPALDQTVRDILISPNPLMQTGGWQPWQTSRPT